MRDPSGTFFEYFADMDQIHDDEAWQVKEDWDLANSWSVWGASQQPEIFFRPAAMEELVEAWNKAH